ncbi:MAG TPA: phenylalanine--tRNA ligase subunit alpha [Pirellulales bacterium]|nr:phenylalanine--tRNA ligase subunit alpha [Pirellulales bacterium]
MQQLESDALTAFRAVAGPADSAALEHARVQFLGAKSGQTKALQKLLGSLKVDEKPAAGSRFHEVKATIDRAFEEAKTRAMEDTSWMSTQAIDANEASRAEGIGQSIARGALSIHQEEFDPTLPGRRPRLGHLHPLTQTIENLKEIMGRLGFTVADGPEVEDEWHNFEALNIPAEHPARDPLENFYLATARTAAGKPAAGPPILLRSQTSTVQIRVMETTPPPVRIISLGRVYRPDTADATHYPMFHQIEGLLVDRNVTMADLKSVLRLFAMSYFGGDVHIRFRPSFFPFTEPSVEVDMHWNDRWIEMGGAGMVDPNVLRAVGYDPEEVTGFAFGLGVERVCARRHHVTDIREFYKNDVRFLEQF